MNLDKLQKRLSSMNSLPEKDKYRPLKDFHTMNAIGFYGRDLIYRVYEIMKPFKLGDVVKPGDVVPQTDWGKVFDNGFLAVRKYFRSKAKAPGLALMYGGTSKVLENHFKVSRSIGLKMFVNFFKELGVLKRHLHDRLEKAKKNLYVENLYGRRLYLPQLADRKTYKSGENKVYNTPIQSTGSESIKIAILKSSQWIEKHHLSRYPVNMTAKMIKGELYSRVVTIPLSIGKRRSTKKMLDRLGNGHTKILAVDEKGKVVLEYHRNVKLDYYTFKKLQGEIKW